MTAGPWLGMCLGCKNGGGGGRGGIQQGGRNVVVSRLNRQRGCMYIHYIIYIRARARLCVCVQYNKMAFSIERQ